jgi:hypothetical protein
VWGCCDEGQRFFFSNVTFSAKLPVFGIGCHAVRSQTKVRNQVPHTQVHRCERNERDGGCTTVRMLENANGERSDQPTIDDGDVQEQRLNDGSRCDLVGLSYLVGTSCREPAS